MTTTALHTWDEIRARVLARDGGRCSVSRLLGGTCSDVLHVHHLIPRTAGGTDEDTNLLTACAACHPRLEALRRAVLDSRERVQPRCRHTHRTLEARLLCESQLARRRRARVLVAA